MKFANSEFEVSSFTSLSDSEESFKLRLFCAIEFPPDVRAKASEQIERLRRATSLKEIRWERTEKLHLTLKFFGDVNQAKISDLTDALMLSASRSSPFELQIEGAGTFPPRGNPRVLWLGIRDATGELSRLQNNIEDECVKVDFARETRPFRPHLTIARTHRMRAEDAHHLARIHGETEFAPARFTVGEIVLMRSELKPSGSIYTSLARFSLGKD
jgi:RNA 2',3'-cyclic 3'-phosphodiesterase